MNTTTLILLALACLVFLIVGLWLGRLMSGSLLSAHESRLRKEWETERQRLQQETQDKVRDLALSRQECQQSRDQLDEERRKAGVTQENLERLGWHIYRIWSTDWFTNPKGETQKLVAAVERRIASGATPNVSGGGGVSPAVSSKSQTSAVEAKPLVEAEPFKSGGTAEKASGTQVTLEVCQSLVEWNNRTKRLSNSYEKQLLSRVDSAIYFLSRKRSLDKTVELGAKAAIERAISLGFDPSKRGL